MPALTLYRLPRHRWLSIALHRAVQGDYRSTDEDHFDGTMRIHRVEFGPVAVTVVRVTDELGAALTQPEATDGT